MPCSEVGDSIVALGKETLNSAMKKIESNAAWKAKVIYGDTDSMFVLLEGRSPEEAFKIGKEMADSITKDNPEPVKLQFEKIYFPLVILSKKHYAGYKYEDINQYEKGEKSFESKGIETVRRDTCESAGKILGKSISILFETKDLSKLKDYLQKQIAKINSGRVVLKEFVVAKEVKLGGYKGDNLPPSAQIAYQRHLADNNYLPRYKERIPYLVILNENNSLKLKDCVISVRDFFRRPKVILNAKYYIEKLILPAVDRILQPINVDVFEWYRSFVKTISTSSANIYYDNFSDIDGNYFNSNKFIDEDDLYIKEDYQRKNLLQIKSGNNDFNVKIETNLIYNDALANTDENTKLSLFCNNTKKINNIINSNVNYVYQQKKIDDFFKNQKSFENLFTNNVKNKNNLFFKSSKLKTSIKETGSKNIQANVNNQIESPETNNIDDQSDFSSISKSTNISDINIQKNSKRIGNKKYLKVKKQKQLKFEVKNISHEKEEVEYVDDLILNDDLFKKKLKENRKQTDFLRYNYFMQNEFSLFYENSYNMLLSDNNYNKVDVEEMLFRKKTIIQRSLRDKIFNWKRKEFENICRFCSNFDKLNMRSLVPCFNFQCKIFYEKKLFEN